MPDAARGIPSVEDGLSCVPKMGKKKMYGKRTTINCVHLPEMDNQSVKSAPPGDSVGYDAGKRIKGRTCHILVDIGITVGRAYHPREHTGLLWSQRVARWSPSMV
jgi:hypothetical protein